jgi:predicted enzyme related to lactoylglutathione lyase
MLALADVAVPVTDARAAAEWWQRTMGFDVHTVGEPGGHAVVVAPPGDRFVLHLCEGFERVDPGNTGIAFMTDDLESHVRRMESAGVRFVEPYRKDTWGGMAKFADPDGNIFWLIGAPESFIRQELARVAEAPGAAPRRRPGRPARSGRPAPDVERMTARPVAKS